MACLSSGVGVRRNGAHLLVDVVVVRALGEERELALDIGGLLSLN
jgi:hypothetical protein